MAQSGDAVRFPAAQRTNRGFPGTTLRIARIAGIDISIHISWFIVFGLVTWSLARGLLPQAVPGLEESTYWIAGAIASLLLFAAVLVHELAHSFVAKARGLEARSITLFIFGGVSNLGSEAKKPATEFLVAVVGPLTSFAIAAACYVIWVVTRPGSLTEAILGYLVFINVALGAFNLIPGFPLDGGRVFRSIVWNATGNLRRATEIAVAVSRVFAYAFMLWGLFRLLNGDLFGGLWTAAIGWFLDNAASAALAQVVFEQRIGRVRVADVYRRDATAVPPFLTVDQLIEDYMLARNSRALPVADDGRILGVVTLADIQKVPPERRAQTPVGDLVRDQKTVCVRPQDSLRSAVEALNAGDFEVLPVLEDGRLAGVLSRADVVRQIELREALGVTDRPEHSPSRQTTA